MMRLVPYPDEKTVLHAQVAVRLLDEFTGALPIGNVNLRLVNTDTQTELDIRPQQSSLGIWSFPGLGLKLQSATTFALIVESDFYEAVEISDMVASPYRRDTGLPNSQLGFRIQGLSPNTNYPYPSSTPLIRGRVRDSNGIPIKGAEIGFGRIEFTRSSSSESSPGFFSIPLRWLPDGVWPSNEIFLTRASQGTNLAVTEITGISKQTRLELVESNSSYRLTKDIQRNKIDLKVNLGEAVDLSGDPDLYIEESFLAPTARRYRIDSTKSSNTNLLLTSRLKRRLPRGTRFSLRTRIADAPGDPAEDQHLLEVEKVNQISSQITLRHELDRKWAPGTRVHRYPSRKPDERVPLELDISVPKPQPDETDIQDQGTHQVLVAVPDHFRFMDIQIPS